MSKPSRTLPSVKIRYFNPNGPKDANGLLGFGEVDSSGNRLSPEEFRKRRQETTEAHEVAVLDAREAPNGGLQSWTLEEHGFSFVPAPEPASDFQDPGLVRADYYPRAAELVRTSMPGARRVIPVSHIVRTENPKNLTAAYAKFAHSDFGPDFEPIFRRMLTTRHAVPEEEAQHCGLCAMNLWAPFDRVAYKDPLCLLVGSSVQMEKDTVPFVYVGTGGASTKSLTYQGSDQAPGLGPVYSPNHRWVFCPDMAPEEAVIFKQYDFRPGEAVRSCFHNSCPDPFHDEWQDCPARRSIELRLLVTFDAATSKL